MDEIEARRDPLPCRFGCREPAVAIVYYPSGCICWPDPVQALCAQHLQKGLQNNEGRVVAPLDGGWVGLRLDPGKRLPIMLDDD